MTTDDAPIEVDTLTGYGLWSQSYDTEYNPLIAVEKREVERLLQGIAFRDVLDAGCGTGRWALKLASMGARVSALDQSPAMLDVAIGKAKEQGTPIDFVCAPLHELLPYDRDTFDLVVCALVFDHLEPATWPVPEFARVARPGGHVLITDFHPDMVAAGGRTVFGIDGVRYQMPNPGLTRDDYVQAVLAAGLEIVAATDIHGSVLPEVVRKAVPLFEQENICLVVLARKPAR